MKQIRVDTRECGCESVCNCTAEYDVMEVGGERYCIVGPDNDELIALANCFSLEPITSIDRALQALEFDCAYGTIGIDKVGYFD